MIASDKAHGILGKADLDLSKYGTSDFQVHRLTLNECAYEDAIVEVHLKGAEKRKKSTRNTPAAQEDLAATSSIMTLQ